MGVGRVIGVVAIGWMCQAALAGLPVKTRVLPGSDPACAEVRAAASEFLLALADDDGGSKARSLFHGSAEQTALLDAYLDVAAAGRHLHGVLSTKFGDGPVARQFDLSEIFRQRARRLDSKLFLLGDGMAFVASDFMADQGIGLERSDGRWRVTRLAGSSHWAGMLTNYLRSFVGAVRQIEADVAASRAGSPEEVLRLMAPRTKALDVMLDVTEQWRDDSVAAVQAVSIGDGEELVALIGEPLGASGVQRVIASLPETSTIGQAAEGVAITAPDTGVVLNFDGKGVLRNVTFYAGGASGHRAFAGQLPAGLTPADTRRDVERKIGPSLLAFGGRAFPYLADYPTLGVVVHYAGKTARDPNNPVHAIAFYTPRSVPGLPSIRPVANAGVAALTFRLVGDPGEPGTDVLPEPLDPTGKATLNVRTQILMDGSAVEDASDDGGAGRREPTGIILTLTPAGERQFDAIVSANAGRRLAIILDGHILVASVLRERVGRRVAISFPPATRGNCPNIANRINAVVTALP